MREAVLLLSLTLLFINARLSESSLPKRIVVLSLSGGAQPHANEDGDDNESRRNSSPLGRIAKQSLSLTGKAAKQSLSLTGKAAYLLLQPKQVELRELFGLWRIDQELYGDGIEKSGVNIEITPKELLVGHDGTLAYAYTFHKAAWGKMAKIEFSFSLDDREPPMFFYRAYVSRKIADSSVIKLKGKIYRIEKRGWRGRDFKHVAVGTFVAKRRLRLQEDIDEEDEEEEEEEEEEDLSEDEPFDEDEEYDDDSDEEKED
jgi:hypothetical protein